ncbi:MAG: hypothetical protein ACREMJ_08640 [Gemmatimonadales bacterium]
MSLQQWARVKPDLNCRLRRGAWYRVVRSNPAEAVLEVHHGTITVPATVVEIRSRRPEHWTVVPLPRDAVDIPFSWGSRYAVCPRCSGRAPVVERVAVLPCPSCGDAFDVAWSERYWD